MIGDYFQGLMLHAGKIVLITYNYHWQDDRNRRLSEPAYTRKVVDVQGGTGRARYVYGRDEVFVYLLGSIFCGTGGCNLLLFTEARDG